MWVGGCGCECGCGCGCGCTRVYNIHAHAGVQYTRAAYLSVATIFFYECDRHATFRYTDYIIMYREPSLHYIIVYIYCSAIVTLNERHRDVHRERERARARERERERERESARERERKRKRESARARGQE